MHNILTRQTTDNCPVMDSLSGLCPPFVAGP